LGTGLARIFVLPIREHADKQRFGIIAAVDISSEMEKQVFRRGFCLARIQDELFVLNTPESFRPRYFGAI
jgi:hypothetical protein